MAQMSRYIARVANGTWDVTDLITLCVVSREPMSHEDAIVLAERLNREVERERAMEEARP